LPKRGISSATSLHAPRDAEPRGRAEVQHEHPVALTAANIAEAQAAQHGRQRLRPAGIAADREFEALERQERRRAEDVDRERELAGFAPADANSEAAVVEQPGIGHPPAAQFGFEFGRRAPDQDPIGHHSRARFRRTGLVPL
jgi:hypothetical protein